MAGILSTVGNIDRLRQITQVLVKHGFGELVARTDLASLVPFRKEAEPAPKKSLPERLRLVLQELGPSFVKLGQVLSTRPDLLPESLVSELKKLQEDVPPVPFADVKKEIEETLGMPIGDAFVEFDEAPLASASIGQVHKAKLKLADDEIVDVAVKVQRPNIRQTVERDLDLLYLMARLVERTIPESSIYSPSGLVAEFDRAITAELDYTIEAKNAERFAKNFADNPAVRFPKVYQQVSGKKVHVAEFFHGKKIDEALQDGYPGAQIARESVRIIAQMIFVDGMFHADPHPGNLRILGSPDKPVVGMLDLGLIGELSSDMRDKATTLMIAAVRQDVDDLADALLAMGKARSKVDKDAFRVHVEKISARHLGKPIKEIEIAALIRDLVEGAVKFEIEMPVEMTMVGKALMTVEGIGKQLDPDLDVLSEARPFFLKILKERYSPEKIGLRLLKAATKFSGAATDVPPLLAEVLDDVRKGRIRVLADDPGMAHAIERLGRRVTLGVLAATLIGTGTALFIHGHPSGAYLMYALAFLSVMIAWGKINLEKPRR